MADKRINIPWSANEPPIFNILKYFYNPKKRKYSTTSTSVPGTLVQQPKQEISVSKEPVEDNTAISEGLIQDNANISEGLIRDNTAISEGLVQDNANVPDNNNPIKLEPIKGVSVFDNKVNTITPSEKISKHLSESLSNEILARTRGDTGKNNWESFKTKFSLFINNPDLWATGRLAVNLGYNDRIYDEYLKGLNPVLKLSYNTYRQVFGDEATKLGYYTRAALLLTRASRPFTSNAEISLAAMFDAYAKGNEMRAEGDRADNQRIRETSELANQHLDANRLRATEVANYNIASMALTKAQKHALLAQKLSAEGSSIDNWLLGIEYRKRLKNARLDAINDLIFALDELERLSNDEDYLKAYNRWEAWKNKHKTASGVVDSSHPDYLKEKNLYTNAILLRQRKSLRRMQAYRANGTTDFDNFIYAKSGTKITRKEKDDLLYKSARDVVEHFRKMIALDKRSSKSKNKIERLAPHPKGDTRKYLLGGVAPFLVYKPIALGGETTTTTSTDTSSTKSKSSEGKDTLDLVKSMFEKMLGKGLPIDVNSIYAQMTDLLSNYESFGSSLDTGDIALMYLQSMLRINNAMYSKELYDKAKEYATKNEALNEFAVDAIGNFIVQDKDGKLSTAKSWKEALTGGKTPITNQQLLYLRAYDPKLASQAGDRLIENVINNGMGINKIGALIKALAGNIGTSEEKIDGLTEVESNKVKSGLLLLANAPDGYYKHTVEDKNQRSQIKAAISYITNMLSPSLRAILETHGGAETLIPMFLTSLLDETHNVSVQPLTGKGAKNADGTSKEGSGDNDMIPAIAFFNGMGEKSTFIILDKTKAGLKIDTISTPITLKGYNTGSITFDKLESSDFGGQLIMNLATMGDSLISSTGRLNIIIDGRIYQTELPIDLEAKRNGITKPDLKFLKNIEIADAKLKLMGIDKSDPKNIPTVNKVYLDNGLPILYTILDNKPVITSEYARFAIVNGIGTEEAFGENPEFNDGIQEISSDKERLLFESLMLLIRKDDKYKLDNGISILGFGSWGETSLYKGIIYIPMVNSNISALAGTGYKAKGDEYNEIEAKQQAADAARELGFKPAGDASNIQ